MNRESTYSYHGGEADTFCFFALMADEVTTPVAAVGLDL